MIYYFTNGMYYNEKEKEHNSRDERNREWQVCKSQHGDFFAIRGYGMATMQIKLEIKEVIKDE